MLRVAYIMTVVWFGDGHLTWSEINYLDSMQECEEYAKSQVQVRLDQGIPREHIASDCTEVVVPGRGKKIIESDPK